MSWKATLDRFIVQAPLAVMTRCLIDDFMGERFNSLFDENRGRQYCREAQFSALAMSVAEICLQTVKNRNQAYKKYAAELGVSSTAYYGKLNRIEPVISEAVVRDSAAKASQLFSQLEFQRWEVLAGYRCLTIDGNHLQKTEKRLKETRGLCAAPLPGTVVGRFDHQTGLFDQAYLLEDAHAQEASVLDRVVDDLIPQDLLIADRHFCIVKFLLSVTARGAFFLIRQHGRLKGKLLGKRRQIGRTDSGTVFEQRMAIPDGDGTLVIRRITVCLDEPTRDGETEIHLLSNVPKRDASACDLADIYRQRWEIENAFHILTMTLNCEMASNCHPAAALFQFCMAMVAFNCRQVLLATLYAEHDENDVDQMSQYQMAIDIAQPMTGLVVAISDEEWRRLTPQSTAGTAQFLRQVAAHVDVRSYRKSVRGPKTPQPKRKRCKAGTHVSVAKLLAERKQRC